MIYIVHGTDYVSNRKLVLNQQKKLGNIIKIEKTLADSTPQELEIQLRSNGMFGEVPFVLLDISANRKTNLDDYISVLEKAPAQATIILLSDRTLGASNIFIKSANKLKAKLIETSKKEDGNVFSFVENVFLKDRVNAYKEFEKIMTFEDNDPIYFFSMLLYGLRTLSYILFDSPKKRALSAFTLSKYEKLAKNYSKKTIIALYNEFYELDKAAKTGILALDMLLPLTMEKVLNSE